jgi:hypothetical protein
VIWVKNELVYVFTPRTGSRTTEAAFLRYVPGAQTVGRHHGFVPGYGHPVYATIRNPLHQVLSHYWRVKDRLSLPEYLKQRKPRLNHLHAVVDRYFIYENGLESIFAALGYAGIQLERIGATHAEPEYLTAERTALISKAFPDDIALYESVRRGFKNA